MQLWKLELFGYIICDKISVVLSNDWGNSAKKGG